VPFFFTWPGRVSAGRVHDAPVNTGSLLPTLQELAGLPVAARADFPSIAGALTGGDCPGAPVFSEIDFGLHQYRDGDRRIMVRDGRWKAIVYRDAATPERFAATEDPVLFDLETDPGERENRAADPACAATLNFLRAGIDRRDAARDERGRADAGY